MAHSIGSGALWAGFLVFVAVMLALDLGVFHRKAHVVGFREAALWSSVYIALALLFNAGIYFKFGAHAALEFLAGYLIEKSLSVDNIFVFVLIFSSLGIPRKYQHRVLFYGLISALAMRAAMILGGAALLRHFHWVLYVFGAFLVLTGIRLFMSWKEKRVDRVENSRSLQFIRRFVPASQSLNRDHFFTLENGRRLATPLFTALLLVEVTDLVFALDSIPAIFAITGDPFIVFTSNIFAILGLRSLFFLVSGLVAKFVYLKLGLSAVLVFIGCKMMLADVFEIPIHISLVVISLLLGGSVLASWLTGAVRSEADSDGAVR